MNPAVLSGQTSIFVTFLASFLIWVLFLGLIVLTIVDPRFRKGQALYAFLATFFSWILSEAIKNFFPSVRPFLIYNTTPMTLFIPYDAAFPSGHSAVATALAAIIWLYNKKIGLIFIFGAILVGVGRVLANVHFSLDVIGGWVIGIISVYLVAKLLPFRVFRKKGT